MPALYGLINDQDTWIWLFSIYEFDKKDADNDVLFVLLDVGTGTLDLNTAILAENSDRSRTDITIRHLADPKRVTYFRQSRSDGLLSSVYVSTFATTYDYNIRHANILYHKSSVESTNAYAELYWFETDASTTSLYLYASKIEDWTKQVEVFDII